MKILALDAALGPFSVALAVDGLVVSERSDCNDALEAGLGRVAALLTRAELALADLDRIAVGLGPGSFTGIRIALSFAKALAYGAHVPLVGVSSYDILTPPDITGACLTAVSGRPGTLCARLRSNGAETIACGPTASVIDRLLGRQIVAGPLTIVAATETTLAEIAGDGTQLRLVSPAARNPARILVQLAEQRRPGPSPHSLAPDYGEVPAVTMPKARTKSAR
ncbi:MAG: tRNA (adenosine(37)-N6)-threonylcarbamoyltransferase complex dimerization subunit type 1 TsaB [Candidatus Velthaea sp.]